MNKRVNCLEFFFDYQSTTDNFYHCLFRSFFDLDYLNPSLNMTLIIQVCFEITLSCLDFFGLFSPIKKLPQFVIFRRFLSFLNDFCTGISELSKKAIKKSHCFQ